LAFVSAFVDNSIDFFVIGIVVVKVVKEGS
jgi:hypothetical protein